MTELFRNLASGNESRKFFTVDERAKKNENEFFGLKDSMDSSKLSISTISKEIKAKKQSSHTKDN